VRELRALLIYLAGVFVGAALLAPWVYHGVQAAAPSMPWLSGITHQPFHRYVNRCLLGLALAGLWPLLQALGARSWKGVGLTAPWPQMPSVFFGLGLGLSSLALVALLGIGTGARRLSIGFLGTALFHHAANAARSSLISIPEELLFRGVLYSRLRGPLGDTPALLLSSSLYAILHFLGRPDSPARVEWQSGFEVLGRMMGGFTHWESMIPSFLTLLLVGIILARLFRTTGALYAPIALHGAWIFWLKLYEAATSGSPGAASWVWGTGKLIDGWSALVVMILCAAVVARWSPRTPSPAR
jgi:hypothetical protein